MRGAGLVSIAAFAGGVSLSCAMAQGVHAPKVVEAGSAFTIETSGSGQGTLYIVGPEQVLKRDVQLGQAVSIPAGILTSAGHYLVYASGGSGESGTLDVVPQPSPSEVTFLARPSRLPVGLRDGITGAAYVYDTFGNLITKPMQVLFQLSPPGGSVQSRTAQTRDGAAWVAMDSGTKEGAARFVASVGNAATTRVIGLVPGDPCSLQMSAKPAGKNVDLETTPVRDCSGNAVPDGTIVTFTENFNGEQSTVDVPLKRGIAKVELPAHPGATITVASGVVLGNQIRVGR